MKAIIGLLLLAGLSGCGNDTSVTKVKKKLNVSPSLVDFGILAVGETATSDVTLTHVDGDAIHVVSVDVLDVAGSWFSVDVPDLLMVEQEGTATLTVQYAPEDDGYHQARMTISTDEEDDFEHVVDLRGGAAIPSADISPPAIDFGPVPKGDTAESSVTITNSGVVNLFLNDLSFSDPRFSTSQTPTVLAMGDQLTVPLSFTADSRQAANATLTLDLGSASLRNVTLRANDCENGDVVLYDEDGDGVASCGGDCDDHAAESHPGAVETCDGSDNDCNNIVDDQTTCYDDDGDGFTEVDGDCDDVNPKVNPKAKENWVNGLDDDCDGVVDYGDQDLDGDGYGTLAGDCDDADATSYPGASELEDKADNDCDGIVDNHTKAYDDDGDGMTENAGDCNDADAGIYAGAREREDGLDNDCDGAVDNGTNAADDDGDGFSENGGDCDDARPKVNPAAQEVSGDGLDNNCDGISL